jgi:hypothetical protein
VFSFSVTGDLIARFYIMAPRKASKAAAESPGQGSDIISDTSPRSINTVKTWTYVSNILQSELINCPDDSSDNEKDDLSTKYKIIAQSEMHKIAARPRIFPYYDMIRWALDHVDIPTRTIFNEQKVAIGTFRPEHLQEMYKLSPTPNLTHNVQFLEGFKKKECEQFGKILSDLIKDWVSHPAKFRADTNGIYSISSLVPQFMYIAMMVCRLYGKEDTSHFFLPWVPLIHTVAEGFSFDWAKLLSDSLASRITEYRAQKASGKASSFFMSAYIMDAIFFMTPFPLMSWSWTPTNAEPIHVYHSKLWEDKAKEFIYEIFNWVMVPMHVSIFGHPPPRISDNITANLSSMEDWYIEAEFSYIRVFGTSVPPYALPLFLPDKLVCREIARKTVLGGISKELKGVSKKVWPPFPIHIGTYSLLDFGHAKAEATTLEEMKLVDIEFKKHDPNKVVSNHMASCGLKRYEHEDSPHDEIFRGARSYSEVLSRVQALLPGDMVDFYTFQEHRRSCLPKVLQGRNSQPPSTQQAEDKSSTGANPRKQETQDKTEETKISNQEEEIPNQEEGNPEIVTKEIDSPIASITPLQFTKGNPDTEWIFKEDLTPISVEELPPSEFFFSKKRKVVVKQETYQRAGTVAKKYKILTDGEALEEEEFTDEVAGTLGAYATTNQYSVGTLKARLKQKNLLINKLEARVATTEANARDEANKGFEQARVLINRKSRDLNLILSRCISRHK